MPTFRFSGFAHELLRLAPKGGRVVVNASKNVPAPGTGQAAYSASKAALTQLARVAALEWGADGIRVNTVHPNAVFDTGIWTKEVLEQRAASYGISVQEYKTNNILENRDHKPRRRRARLRNCVVRASPRRREPRFRLTAATKESSEIWAKFSTESLRAAELNADNACFAMPSTSTSSLHIKLDRDKIQAAIFDMDGVVIDSEPIHELSLIVVSEQLGRRMSWQETKQFKGSTELDCARLLIKITGNDRTRSSENRPIATGSIPHPL